MVDVFMADTVLPILQTLRDVECYSTSALTLNIDDIGYIIVTIAQHLSSTTS